MHPRENKRSYLHVSVLPGRSSLPSLWFRAIYTRVWIQALTHWRIPLQYFTCLEWLWRNQQFWVSVTPIFINLIEIEIVNVQWFSKCGPCPTNSTSITWNLPQFSVWLFVTPWTALRQASLSITNSQSSLKLMSIESVMPSNNLILCRPLVFPPSIFPSIRVFSSELALHIRGPKHWSSASASFHPVNIQGGFPLGLTGLISLQFTCGLI